MKEKDLFVDFKPQQHVYYVEKDDHSFGPVVSGSQLSKNYLDDYWDKMQRLERTLRDEIVTGKCSPVKYFMLLQELSESELAARAGVSVRRLRKHLTPTGFANMKLGQLAKYAEVFNLPVAGLLQTILLQEELKTGVAVAQQQTGNTLFSVLKIEQK